MRLVLYSLKFLENESLKLLDICICPVVIFFSSLVFAARSTPSFTRVTAWFVDRYIMSESIRPAWSCSFFIRVECGCHDHIGWMYLSISVIEAYSIRLCLSGFCKASCPRNQRRGGAIVHAQQLFFRSHFLLAKRLCQRFFFIAIPCEMNQHSLSVCLPNCVLDKSLLKQPLSAKMISTRTNSLLIHWKSICF